MKPNASAVLAAVFVALAPAAPGAAAAAVPTLAPDALRPGQKAVVRTVFEGSRIEEFEAELVGVLSSGRAAGDVILARATSERVVRTGVAQGMSGSPVYVDGRLIGALSSGWAFTREPLFGITPIGEMLDVLALPETAGATGSTGPGGLQLPGGAGAPRFRELAWSDATDDEPTPAGGAVPAHPTPLALPLAATGLHLGALDPVRAALAPFHLAVTPGGRAADGGPAPERLEPGSAVAVDLLRGDLQLSAIGTVTWREGDRVLLFGHPFFQAGEVRLPLSTAEITTVVASEATSFKLGVRGREAGTATQDRRAAVAGVLGPTPRLLPIAVRVAGAGRPDQRFRFESVEDRALAPTLVGVAALNSVLERGGTSSGQTLRWTLTAHRGGAAPLVIRDVAAGDAPAGELLTAVAAPLRFLFGNPFERLALDSVALAVEAEPGRRLWTLRSARVLDAVVRPGGAVRVRCEVEPWQGAIESRELALRVPAEAADGRYVLWVGGGPELSRFEAQRLPGRFRPVSLDDAWARLARSRPSDGLHAVLLARAPEVSSDGRDYPELPLSALALLAGGQVAGDRSRRGDTAWLDERRVEMDGVLRGELLLQVQVDGRAP